MSRARAIWRTSACALYLLLLSQAWAGVRAEASTAQIANNVVVLEAPSPPVNATEGKKESIAKILDDALKEEFKREGEAQAEQGHHFNETSKLSEVQQETVILISNKPRRNSTTSSQSETVENGTELAAARPPPPPPPPLGTPMAVGQLPPPPPPSHDSDKSLAVETEVDRIIDSKDNEYVLSRSGEEGSLGITLDPQLVRDLTVLVASSAVAGVGMELAGQPAINGYFLAGSLMGPGGLAWVKEIVQVQSVAQLGVQLLLFTLGLEFSASKIRAVRGVAIAGGALQLLLSALLAAGAAELIGSSGYQGFFLGALAAMSSTSVVLRVLTDWRAQSTLAGQITIGTLVTQDFCVGLLFALLPVLARSAEGVAGGGAPGAGGAGGLDVALLATRAGSVLLTLAASAAAAAAAAAWLTPPAARWLHRRATPATFQLSALALCFGSAVVTTRLGIGAEVGAFLAGVALSGPDAQETVLRHVEPCANLMLALFISTTGLVLSPQFLLHHLPVLAMGVAVVVLAKTAVVAAVVAAFGYPPRVALAVGLNLAQIGEFGFVLLSLALTHELLPSTVYLLLMGTTALSLLVTPLWLSLARRIAAPRQLPSGTPVVSQGSGGGWRGLADAVKAAHGRVSPPPFPVPDRAPSPESVGQRNKRGSTDAV